MKIHNESNLIRDIAKEGYKAINEVMTSRCPDESPDLNTASEIGDSYLKAIATSKSAGIIEKTVAESVKQATSSHVHGHVVMFNDSKIRAQEAALKAISHGLPPTLSSAIAEVGIKILNTPPHNDSFWGDPSGDTHEDLKTMGESLLNDIEKKSKDSYAKEMAKSAEDAVKNMEDLLAVKQMEDVFGKIAKHK